ncbi:MAG: fused DSP-PTPase phosphatase/NAD kinase-like protein [Candidatus Acidiferrales bacterium]
MVRAQFFRFEAIGRRSNSHLHPTVVRMSLEIRHLAGTLLVALSIFVAGPTLHTQSKARHSTIAHAPAKREILVGVPNFGEVTPTLYRGAQPSDKGFQSLAKMGIDVIVDFRGWSVDQEKHEAAERHIKLVLLSWDCRHPSDQIAARFLQILKENSGKKIFVHCYGGIDRTGTMIAVYRMAEQGWTEPEAMNEMRAFGYAFMHHVWCHAAEVYVKKFPQAMQEDPQLAALHAGAPPHAAN